MTASEAHIVDIATRFEFEGAIVGVKALERGHINDTYICTAEDRSSVETRYVLQRINHNVFPDVPKLMENVQRVVEHLSSKIADSKEEHETLILLPTQDGEYFTKCSSGSFWRMYRYIDRADSFDECTTAQQAYQAAKTCGLFQRYLIDCNPEQFHDTIPRFHDTEHRYAEFELACESDAAGRLVSAGAEVDFIRERKKLAGLLVEELRAGNIPNRVTHNDLKFNNFLFREGAETSIAIVDLDTCMPGTALYDFGDFVRDASVSAAENETDLSKVSMDIGVFEAICRGYLEEMGELLSTRERELLCEAPLILTLELGIRFLTDYINGDVYFKTSHPRENLDRARVQLAIVKSMEAQQEAMRAVLRGLLFVDHGSSDAV